MEELYILINNFLDDLDKEESVIELKKSFDIIKKDKELCSLLKDFNPYNEQLKEKLLSNNKIMDAKKKEADCNYLILYINSYSKEINNK